jgi:ATP-dependent DNA ligase
MKIASDVWQFLGTDKQRTDDKTAMKVKHIDEVPDSKKKDRWYMGQIKKDGVYCLVVRLSDGSTALFSRTGKRFTNTFGLKFYLDKYMTAQLRPGVYITELCCDACSLEVLSGIVNPNRTKALDDIQKACRGMLYLAFHDYLHLDEFMIGSSTRPYHDRYQWLQTNLPGGLALLDVYLMQDLAMMDRFFEDAVASGEEGVVYKDGEAGWVAGHKGWRMMKKVRGVDYDLLCTGWEEGTGKYKGKVANLLFQWKGGETVKAMLGKGWTHDMAEEMFNEIHYGEWHGMPEYEHVNSPVGKIFQVYALQESSKGKLRLPKVGELRHDKEEADV